MVLLSHLIQVLLIAALLGTPIYFFWRWFFLIRIGEQRKRRRVVWITTVISTPVIYLTIILGLLAMLTYYPTRDFDRKAWMADKEKRYQMSGDIIKSKMLIGKTKAQVKALLGDDGQDDKSDYWGYYLGFVPEIANIDPDILDITFKNGKVIAVSQHNS